jgi:hypothetical protein
VVAASNARDRAIHPSIFFSSLKAKTKQEIENEKEKKRKKTPCSGSFFKKKKKKSCGLMPQVVFQTVPIAHNYLYPSQPSIQQLPNSPPRRTSDPIPNVPKLSTLVPRPPRSPLATPRASAAHTARSAAGSTRPHAATGARWMSETSVSKFTTPDIGWGGLGEKYEEEEEISVFCKQSTSAKRNCRGEKKWGKSW